MKIKAIGKAHLSGTAKKTGKLYDFIQVHYNGKARGVDGQAAMTLVLDPQEHPLASITVGADYMWSSTIGAIPWNLPPCPPGNALWAFHTWTQITHAPITAHGTAPSAACGRGV